jgi:FtsP/CotA-like multicopper oxidase with cupredoxin domain
MRIALAAAVIAPLLTLSSFRSSAAPERITINDNRSSAGVLRDGVLTLRLEAREGEWHPDRDSDPGILVRAFAEEGKSLLVPGPLVRVPEGTEVRAFVRNTLARDTLTVHGLSTRGTAPASGADTIQIPPGVTRDVRFIAGTPGTYYYRGTTHAAQGADRPRVDAELSGAFVIDPRGAPSKPRDRVFVISVWSAKELPGGLVNRGDLLRFTINGRTWPNTERLTYTVGDTVHFRIINTSVAVHPMHLHGFYFNVDSRGDGRVDTLYDRAKAPHAVVTERVVPGRTFSMTWVPERAGNWLFHCHDNFHVLRSVPLDGTPLPSEHMLHITNHALEMMGGLVMGIEVKARPGTEVIAQGSPRRKLRLVARVDSGGSELEPAYGYVLQDGATSTPSKRPLLPGPTIVLKRGEPVSITVVNELPEATAVHWHGIELESYFDGVAGFAGSGTHIAPAIAPRDSFEARFTPPRSGTFIYHPHADEVRQQQAGLSGALLVVDAPETYNPTNDIVLLLSVPRLNADAATVLINGSNKPAALELRVGERYRLRLVDIHTFRPSMIARLLRDSTLVTWRAIAKDGMDLPRDQATTRPAVQQMGNGETYDFEFTPTAPGDLQFTVSTAVGVLLVSMPVHIR